MNSLRALTEAFESLWPLTGAEPWDAPGLVSGNPTAEIGSVLLSVDVTYDLVTEASGRYDLVLAHHPFIMRGVSSISEGSAKGRTLAAAIRANLAIYSAHTNADIVEAGVSAALAEALAVRDAVPLVANSATQGHGRIGELEAAISLGDFARRVAQSLPATASGVRVAGDYTQSVKRIAVCGGAGDSFIEAAVSGEADVYLTSDLRHHVVQDARETAMLNGGKPAIIDVSHWASEWIWLERAASELRKIFPKITFDVSDLRTDPFDFVVTQ